MPKRKRERVWLMPPLPESIEEEPADSHEDVLGSGFDQQAYEYTRRLKGKYTRSMLINPPLNVSARVEGTKLILEVDLSKKYGIPEGRRNVRVASSRGPKPIPDHRYAYYFWQMSAWRYPSTER